MEEEYYSSNEVKSYLSTTYCLQRCLSYIERMDTFITNPPIHPRSKEKVDRLKELRSRHLSFLEKYLQDYDAIPPELRGGIDIDPEMIRITYDLD